MRLNIDDSKIVHWVNVALGAVAKSLRSLLCARVSQVQFNPWLSVSKFVQNCLRHALYKSNWFPSVFGSYPSVGCIWKVAFCARIDRPRSNIFLELCVSYSKNYIISRKIFQQSFNIIIFFSPFSCVWLLPGLVVVCLFAVFPGRITSLILLKMVCK